MEGTGEGLGGWAILTMVAAEVGAPVSVVVGSPVRHVSLHHRMHAPRSLVVHGAVLALGRGSVAAMAVVMHGFAIVVVLVAEVGSVVVVVLESVVHAVLHPLAHALHHFGRRPVAAMAVVAHGLSLVVVLVTAAGTVVVIVLEAGVHAPLHHLAHALQHFGRGSVAADLEIESDFLPRLLPLVMVVGRRFAVVAGASGLALSRRAGIPWMARSTLRIVRARIQNEDAEVRVELRTGIVVLAGTVDLTEADGELIPFPEEFVATAEESRALGGGPLRPRNPLGGEHLPVDLGEGVQHPGGAQGEFPCLGFMTEGGLVMRLGGEFCGLPEQVRVGRVTLLGKGRRSDQHGQTQGGKDSFHARFGFGRVGVWGGVPRIPTDHSPPRWGLVRGSLRFESPGPRFPSQPAPASRVRKREEVPRHAVSVG